MYTAGKTFVYSGMGLVQIEGVVTSRKGGDFIRARSISPGGGVMMVPIDKAGQLLRPPVSRERAELWLETLRSTASKADERPLRARYREALKTALKGSDEERVRLLQRLYASPFKGEWVVIRVVDKLQESIVGEIAFVLQRPDEELVAELRKAHSATGTFSPKARTRLPEPQVPRPTPAITLEGYEFLGQFTLNSDQLVVGDPIYLGDEPENSSCAGKGLLLLDAVKGSWLAFIKEADGRIDELLAIHAEEANGIAALRGQAREAGRVWVDGAKVGILDAAVRREERFEDAMLYSLDTEQIVEGRGCMSQSGDGDGVFPISVSSEQGRAVFVSVVF
jgi:hypothetical protein